MSWLLFEKVCSRHFIKTPISLFIKMLERNALHVSICLFGLFSLFQIFSSDEKLHFGVIICSFGVRYRFYCSNIVRTLMVEPTEEQQNIYTYLLSLLDIVIDKLRDGKSVICY